MTKEQFLAMSLPYGLKAKKSNDHIVKIKGIDTNGNSSIYYYWNANGISEFVFDLDFKPILRPLTDLTKGIAHNGKRLIPILKLLEANSFDINENPLGLIEKYKGIYFDTDLLSLSDALLLIEWHFDICGLIDTGEAIDVNSLDKNPYK